MKALIALVCLVSYSAFAADALPSDAPVAVEVVSGTAVIDENGTQREVILPPGLFLNQPGAVKITAIYNAQEKEVANLTAQNEALKAEVDKIVESPPFNWKMALIIAASALAVGAAVGIGVTVAVKK